MAWNPRVSVVESARAFRAARDGVGLWPALRRKAARLRHRFWSVVTGSDIVLGASLGERLSLPHPTGVVIHQDAVVGDDCMIMQQVTIGQLAGPGVPVLGSRVYVGAGAKILGPVRIGDGARIGANAVVLTDVPPDHTAVGVPAVARPRATGEDSQAAA